MSTHTIFNLRNHYILKTKITICNAWELSDRYVSVTLIPDTGDNYIMPHQNILKNIAIFYKPHDTTNFIFFTYDPDPMWCTRIYSTEAQLMALAAFVVTFIIGLIIGTIYALRRKKKKTSIVLIALLAIILVVVTFFLVRLALTSIPWLEMPDSFCGSMS